MAYWYSPGESTARRARLEAALTAAMLPAIRSFLVEVEKAALAPTLTAGVLDHFTLGAVTERWKSVVDFSMRTVLIRLGISDDLVTAMHDHPYLRSMSERMTASDLPSAAYTSAQMVMAQAYTHRWDSQRTAIELARAMDMSTGTFTHGTHSGMAWDALARRIARTEATAVYNFSALEELAADPNVTHKRWVAHHDQITRDTHLTADGQTVPLSASFIVGDEALMVPGDPSGSPAVSFNCRCVIYAVRSEA